VRRSARILGRIDLMALALALPVFVIAGLPLAGYAAVAIGWLAQAAVQRAAQARLARPETTRTNALGLVGGSIVVRLWVVTLPILVVGLASSHEAGLAAAVLAAVLVTAQFAGEALVRLTSSQGGSE
jgi:hypothetical protein